MTANSARLANAIAENLRLRAILVRQVEKYFGCPIQDIPHYELARWARLQGQSNDECEAVWAVLTQHAGLPK